jgi:PEP-CTERM motif
MAPLADAGRDRRFDNEVLQTTTPRTAMPATHSPTRRRRPALATAITAAFLGAALSLAHAAPATVLLADNFDSEHGGVGSAEYSGFANFSAANVDLLAPGYFFNLCQLAGGSTPCIDMEGSGNGAMTTRTAYDLAPGIVTLQFDLAGDQRGRSGNSVDASLVSVLGEVLYSETFMLASDVDFTTFTRTVSIGAATQARLRFQSGGPAESMGMLLDNVVLSAGGDVAAPVPEPSTWALFAGGLVAVGTMLRRRRAH